MGSLAYVAGGYFTAKPLCRDLHYAQLLWLTSIDRDLQAGRVDRARSIIATATDATLTLLESIERQPLPVLMTVFGAFDMKQMNDRIATRAKQHFLPISDSMSQESKAFLNGIVEVDNPPSQCSIKKKE